MKLVTSPYGQQKPLNVDFYSNSAGTLQCKIMNQQGKQAHNFSYAAIQGINQLQWDLVMDKDKGKKIEKGEYAFILDYFYKKT